jgi:hypothetical protein
VFPFAVEREREEPSCSGNGLNRNPLESEAEAVLVCGEAARMFWRSMHSLEAVGWRNKAWSLPVCSPGTRPEII